MFFEGVFGLMTQRATFSGGVGVVVAIAHVTDPTITVWTMKTSRFSPKGPVASTIAAHGSFGALITSLGWVGCLFDFDVLH